MKSAQTYLYHGTSDAYLTNILAIGLHPASSSTGYLCYSNRIEISEYHAAHMASWDSQMQGRRCKPIVFKILIDRFSISKFCVDRNFILLGASAGPLMGERMLDDMTWRDMLRDAGSVGYSGIMTVQPDDIIADI